MKKQIRLLIENLFDDIYDIDQRTDLSVEIADEHLKYNYFPKNFNELRNLLTKLLKERGKDADLNDIDVSQVTTFYNENIDLGLFEKLNPHNIDIKYWDVSNVEYMAGTFYKCKNFNSDLSKWNVCKVKNMGYMFFDCPKFNCNLDKWNVSNVEYWRGMFDGCTSLKNKPSWYKK